MDFPKRLETLRKERGLNKKEAAALLNMPYTTYVNYEAGTREPNSLVLGAIAKEYDASIDFLLGRTELRTFSTPAQDKQSVREGAQALQREFVRLGLIPEDRDLTDEELAVLIDYFKNNAEFIKARMDQVRNPD